MVQVEKDVFLRFKEQKRLLFYSILRGKTLRLCAASGKFSCGSPMCSAHDPFTQTIDRQGKFSLSKNIHYSRLPLN